ncbi:MAG: CO dehydrogenase/CO-methylating acetyl-CoA synthase complex subunit beta [Armatimonadetes bacterium]|nr:CO dehydrogenase/CO-methylating acetyl-CoA synthase complex subunit beta [Armatimonadota bacterium]
MSKIIASIAINGAHKIVSEAEKRWEELRESRGESAKVEFPETAFYLPMANALLGVEVKTVGEMKPVLNHARQLISCVPAEECWLPYLGAMLDAGVASLLAEEIIVALRYLEGEEPQPDCNGFFSDTMIRTLGLQLVDGRMPGFAAIIGAAPDVDTAVMIVRELQKRSILTFVGSNVNGVSIIDQLKEGNVEMGWDTYVVPYGRDTITAIYPLHWAIRSALTYGGIKPGEAKKALDYCKNHVFAFGLVLGEVDEIKCATGAGAISMGFPIIADTVVPQILQSGICTYEALVSEPDHRKIVQKCVEVRGVKVTISEIDIPVSYSPAFEGERVRREDMHVEFGSKYSTAFEYLRARDPSDIDDGKIELVGADIDSVEPGSAMPLGIVVDVGGRKMQKDFEPIMERQIHMFLNEAMGIFHMGQRNIIWVRISKEAYEKGFRLKHFGTILYAQMHKNYGKIIDKVAVTIYTDEQEIQRILPEAIAAYNERDERVAGMTDESVDTFYSCTLCQSYAPNHVCIITPERLGLCGAYNWLDAKAAYEMNPAGCNQPISKSHCIDPILGQWEEINQFVYEHSKQAVSAVSLYSVMVDPMTSCGCFECILAIVPEANGFMIVNREYSGMTPSGMSFSTLAGSVGGGNVTPGFLGVGRLYVASRKFISADGGLKRLVWMPKELKDFLHDRLIERGKEIGIPDMIDKIADETVATTAEELLSFTQEVGHPALEMPPLF